MDMEGRPTEVPQPEKAPNPWEAVQEFLELSPRERELCSTCTPENKGPLIEWYVEEQARAEKDPTGRDAILFDIKASAMQYMIAKDMEQRGEAIKQLNEAADRAFGSRMPELIPRVDKTMDLLEAAVQ